MAKQKKLRTVNHRVVLNRSAGGDFAITFMLLILGLFIALPMYLQIINAFKPLSELFRYPPRFYVTSPTTANFKNLFTLITSSWVPFTRYIFNTVFISLAGTFGTIILSAVAAYSLSKMNFPGKVVFFKSVIYAMMIPSAVGGIVTFILISRLGMMDTYWAYIVPAWGATTNVFLMKQFMEANVTDAVLESARLDGASELRIFWQIAMPMVKPAWLTIIVFSFNGLWKTPAITYVQSEQLKTFPASVNQILSAGIARTGEQAASAFLLMFVPIIVFIITQSNIIETMGSSGMKD